MPAPVFWLAVSMLAGRPAATETAYVDQIETLALIEQLNGELLASRSATLTLEHWCSVHKMAPVPRVVALRDKAAHRLPTVDQRARLQVGPDEPLGYRHVLLTCGQHVLSEADNWYVPSRLTPEMNQALETSDTPFGRVILPLNVHRQSISVDRLWSPVPQDWINQPRPDATQWTPPGPALFRHRALLITPQGLPIAEVEETYSRQALDFNRHGKP